MDLLLCAAHSPKGKNQVFLASDGTDLSTGKLLIKLKALMQSKTLLFSAPPKLVRFSLTLFGKGAIAQRLFDSLEVNIQKTVEYLNWNPPQTVNEGLRETVYAFQDLHETRL